MLLIFFFSTNRLLKPTEDTHLRAKYPATIAQELGDCLRTTMQFYFCM